MQAIYKEDFMIRNFNYWCGKYTFLGDSKEECILAVEQLNKRNSSVSLEVEQCISSVEDSFWICVVVPHKKNED